MEEEEDDESPYGGGPARRKKLRLTKEQSRFLEESFRQNHTLNLREKETLAEILGLKPRQVEVWFQNRRARFNNDFFYEIKVTVLGMGRGSKRIDGFQKAAVQMVKPAKGTTTLAFIIKDGVMVAADSRASTRGYISSQSVKKIIEINPYMLGTMAGGVVDCQFWHINLEIKVTGFVLILWLDVHEKEVKLEIWLEFLRQQPTKSCA